MNKIFTEVKELIDPVYMVGGSVRDELLGKEPKDYDFCTPLLPAAIEAAIKKAGKKAYGVGKRFGTLGVKINGQIAEITTFRTEVYEDNNRKPKVNYVNDIAVDLSRRDFTINAIAKNGTNYIDPFNGQQDLKDGIIRCVGKPNERFKEDPLRMLRVARFASQLGFTVDETTEDMCSQLNYKILSISKERWVMELDKILLSSVPSVGLDFLARTRILNFILPEIALQIDYDQNNPHHTLKLWDHTKKVVDNVPADIDLRWAALLHDIAKPYVKRQKLVAKDVFNVYYFNYLKHDVLGGEFVQRLAGYLKWSNSRRDTVYNLVINHMAENSPLKEADRGAK